MTGTEYAKKLEELDRQPNDPDVPMDPARVWALVADLREHARRTSSTEDNRTDRTRCYTRPDTCSGRDRRSGLAT